KRDHFGGNQVQQRGDKTAARGLFFLQAGGGVERLGEPAKGGFHVCTNRGEDGLVQRVDLLVRSAGGFETFNRGCHVRSQGTLDRGVGAANPKPVAGDDGGGFNQVRLLLGAPEKLVQPFRLGGKRFVFEGECTRSGR